MHRGVLLTRRHREHHATNVAKGVLPEFRDYMVGTSPLLPWGFLVSPPVGVGWLAGASLYGLFSAFGHQLQHDHPTKCFWMRRMPIHYVHHRFEMVHHNFGLAVPWWDHVFGTYRFVTWDCEELHRRDHVPFWRIRWW